METTCQECGMLIEANEYHPYAACLMFKACQDGEVVRENLKAVRCQPPVNIDTMVDRFLQWELPKDFAPDAGISFKTLPHPHEWPTGTNLFDAIQAEEMIKHMLGDQA